MLWSDLFGLLGALLFSRTVTAAGQLSHTALSNSTTLLNNTTAINQDLFLSLSTQATQRKTYPRNETIPTWKIISDEALQAAIQCLANWCESDHTLRPESGKVRCRTQGNHGVEAFICNPGHQARCSTVNIGDAISEIRKMGSQTGVFIREESKNRGLAFGFEPFCVTGSGECGPQFDPVDAHCNSRSEEMRQSRLQFHGVVHYNDLGGYVYKGPTWINQPTPRPSPPKKTFHETKKPKTADPNAGPIVQEIPPPPKPGQYPQRPDQYRQRPDQYRQRPDQYPQRPDQYPQRPDQYPQKPDQYPQRPAQYPQSLDRYPQKSAQAPQGSPQPLSSIVLPSKPIFTATLRYEFPDELANTFSTPSPSASPSGVAWRA